MKNILPVLFAGILCCAAVRCTTPKSAVAGEQAAAGPEGAWILDLLPAPGNSFDSLYPGRKPELSFNPAQGTFSGYTGCNQINGPLRSDKHTINFKEEIAATMMACPGEGEAVFLKNLKRVNRYSVSADGKELTLIQGDIALMHFHKK